MRKFFVRLLWTAFVVAVLATAGAFFAIAEGWIGYVPPVDELQNPISRFATQVISADGKVMGTWNYNKENRICIPYSELSPRLVEALIATEDVRFREHSGIDFISLGRAVVKRGLLGNTSAGGGSTITQQLAKQLYSEKAHSVGERLLQKPIEWVIAVRLERCYTKDEIISLYLNYFDFLHNAVGIKTAANTYFGKEPRDLTLCEAATLIGLCKNPSYFNPVRHHDRARQRRNVVLSQMRKAGYLTDAEYATASREELKLNFHVSDHKDGVAAYFRDFLRRYMMAKRPERADYPAWGYNTFYRDSINWETDPLYGWCNKNTNREGRHYNVYTDGLKIHTTIDSRMQAYAERAVRNHVGGFLQPAFSAECRGRKNAPYSGNLTPEQMTDILYRSIRQCERYRVMQAAGASEQEIRAAFRKPVEMSVFTYKGETDTVMSPIDSIRYYKKLLRCGFISMSPHDGAVKAYVGGVDFTHFNYDMCTEGRRQVGSTIKPLLYSLAMESGFTPCDLAPNVQQTYIVAGKPWTPRNANRRRYGEMVTLKWGLAQSNNWISAYLMSKLNPQQFVTLLRAYGINNPDIHPSMALCLGPCDISVSEMVSAYTAFANHGMRCAPLYVTKIEDNEGNTVATFAPRMNEVISDESASRMLYMLKAVVDGGTAGRLRFRYNIEGDIAGKTGTTNSNSDAWFIGLTPELVSGVWVGGDDRDIHFGSMQMGQGATMALPVWAYYMRQVMANAELGYPADLTFDLPDNYNPCLRGEEEETFDESIEEIYE